MRTGFSQGDSIEDAANGGAGNALFDLFLRASASASGSCLKRAPALGADRRLSPLPCIALARRRRLRRRLLLAGCR